MDVLLQRHCARHIYLVPNSLKELMSDISREVLRSGPTETNVYKFIADYLDALIITRENAAVAARLVQSITDMAEHIIELLEGMGLKEAEAEVIAQEMHKTFKRYIDRETGMGPVDRTEDEIVREIIAKAKITAAQADTAAVLIQQAFRRFKERRDRERRLMIGLVDWRVAARSTIYLYKQTGVSVQEAHRAATLIKAAYKGFYTRRMMKKISDEAALLSEADSREDEASLLGNDEIYGEYELSVDAEEQIEVEAEKEQKEAIVEDYVRAERVSTLPSDNSKDVSEVTSSRLISEQARLAGVDLGAMIQESFKAELEERVSQRSSQLSEGKASMKSEKSGEKSEAAEDGTGRKLDVRSSEKSAGKSSLRSEKSSEKPEAADDGTGRKLDARSSEKSAGKSSLKADSSETSRPAFRKSVQLDENVQIQEISQQVTEPNTEAGSTVEPIADAAEDDNALPIVEDFAGD